MCVGVCVQVGANLTSCQCRDCLLHCSHIQHSNLYAVILLNCKLWCDGMNGPLQVSADCLVLHVHHTRAPTIFLHTLTVGKKKILLITLRHEEGRGGSLEEDDQTPSMDFQNNTNQSVCDQGGRFVCKLEGLRGKKKNNKRHTSPLQLFSCGTDQTQPGGTCYATPV